MKKLIISFVLAIATSFAFAQNCGCGNNPPGANVQIAPHGNGNPGAPYTVCYGTDLSIDIAGNSFVIDSILWSTGETTLTIQITQSGTYHATIWGTLGQSNNHVMITRCRYYTVLPRPTITPLTALTVCRYETIRLTTSFSGCGATLEWFSTLGGYQTGPVFEEVMYHTASAPRPDTLHVWAKITINGCSMYSDTVRLRAIRLVNGVGLWFCGTNRGNKFNTLTDSIPSDFALENLYPIQYRMEFTDVLTGNVIVYTTALGSRMAPASILQPGRQYYVKSWPIENGITYCSGDSCLIGTKPLSVARVGDLENSISEDVDFKIFPNPANDFLNIKTELDGTIEIFDSAGRLMFSKEKTESIEEIQISDYKPGLYVVVMEGARQKFVKN